MGLPWKKKEPSGRRRTVALLVTSSESGRSWSWTLSFAGARALLACLAMMPVLLLAVAGLVARVGVDHVRLAGLTAENDSLEKQFARIQNLEEELERMVRLGDQMRALAGVDSTDVSGAAWSAESEDVVREP